MGVKQYISVYKNENDSNSLIVLQFINDPYKVKVISINSFFNDDISLTKSNNVSTGNIPDVSNYYLQIYKCCLPGLL